MRKICILFSIFFISYTTVYSQQNKINRKQFFLDDSIINIQFTTDIKKLKGNKNKPDWQPASIIVQWGDSLINEKIRVEPRGNYRKEHCEMASLMIDFKTKTSPFLSELKTLKFVGGCHENSSSEDLVLREYLVYKLYNILSPMSFRVRLLRVTYYDSQKKIKSYTQYAFLIEDIGDLAKRNDCKEITKKAYATETTNKEQITFVSIFQYMIGNTDWAVPNYHNIKLMVPRSDTLASPYVVPYDFDYCGLVDAPYALPNEELNIKSVKERYYQGYKRPIEYLKTVASTYNNKHDELMQCVNNFSLLKQKDKEDVTDYLDQFFKTIKSESSIRYAFITNGLAPY